MRLGMQRSFESQRSAFKAVIGSVVEGGQRVLALSNPRFELTALTPGPFAVLGLRCVAQGRSST